MFRAKYLVSLAIPALLLALPVGRAQAFDHHHGGYYGGGFYGRSFHSFSPHDLGIWRGGTWSRDWHDGRFGWWWIVGPWWYFYPAPVYPYPQYVPPAVVEEQAPPVPTGLPPSQYWYYCDNPQGYYPYVASCGTPWRPVPAAPPR